MHEVRARRTERANLQDGDHGSRLEGSRCLEVVTEVRLGDDPAHHAVGGGGQRDAG